MMDLISRRQNLQLLKGRYDSMREAKGVVDAVLKATEELGKMEVVIEADKNVRKKKLAHRETLIQGACYKLNTEVNKLLTSGDASIEVAEGRVSIGWIKDGRVHPLGSLSGGEQVEFVNALSQAICNNENPLTYLELAEVGNVTAEILHAVHAAQKGQVIACTWQEIEAVGWTKICL